MRVYKKVESNVIDFLIMEKEREIVKAKLLLNNINYLERQITINRADNYLQLSVFYNIIVKKFYKYII